MSGPMNIKNEYGVVSNIEVLRQFRNTSKEKYNYIYGGLNAQVILPQGHGGLY
jgi:hypothetical protein